MESSSRPFVQSGGTVRSRGMNGNLLIGGWRDVGKGKFAGK